MLLPLCERGECAVQILGISRDTQGPVAPACEALNNCLLCPFAARMSLMHEVVYILNIIVSQL